MKTQRTSNVKSKCFRIFVSPKALVVYGLLVLSMACKVATAPATGGSAYSGSQQNGQYYSPTKESVPNVSRYKARWLLEDAIQKCENYCYFQKVWSNAEWSNYGKMKLLGISQFSDSSFTLEFQPTYPQLMPKDKPMRKYTIAFSPLDIPSMEWGKRKGLQLGFLVGKKVLWILGAGYDEGKQLLDALYILKNKDQNAEDRRELESFKPIAQQYRSLSTKPTLNEDARRYLIQATNATEEKRYSDGINLLEKALVIDPAYPLAHFNRALLLAQVSIFGEAILEMKKYLMLVPDAKDARASQDKIYEWEGKLSR